MPQESWCGTDDWSQLSPWNTTTLSRFYVLWLGIDGLCEFLYSIYLNGKFLTLSFRVEILSRCLFDGFKKIAPFINPLLGAFLAS